MQVVYAVASDQTDRYATFVNSIKQWAADADKDLSDSATPGGESRHLRFVHDSSCHPTVAKAVMATTGDDSLIKTINDLLAKGYNRDDRKYLVFVDANVYCGIGEIFDDDSKGAGNVHNGYYGMFSRVDLPCWDGDTAIHELSHNLGAVQKTAPHSSGGYHCTDEYDVMCYSDSPNYPTMNEVCATSQDRILDCNRDDYFNVHPTNSSYLGTHWNIADSNFMLGSDGTDYVPITPTRVVDTRNGKGTYSDGTQFTWPFYADETRTFRVAGVYGIPDYADAVVMNVTAAHPTGNSFLTVYPAGTPRPTASNLNTFPGVTRPNLVTTPVGFVSPVEGSGWVSVYNYGGSVDLVADVIGYYAHRDSLRFVPVAPSRVLDSRKGLGGYSTKWGAGTTRTVSAASVVPSGATSVVLNVTATRPTKESFVTVFAAGATRPGVSNLNFRANNSVPNLVVTKVNASRQFALYNYTGSVDLLADVVGYFTTPASGREFVPLAPTRVLDSRSGNGTTKAPWSAGSTRTVQISGRGGVPTTASAVVINVTGTHSTVGGFVTLWPNGATRPSASTLNLAKGVTTPNLAMIKLGTGGQVKLYNYSGSVDLIGDVVGYFK